MVKLLEALRQDLSQPLDDRRDEISEWLDLPAGRIKRRLGLPDAVAEDLHADDWPTQSRRARSVAALQPRQRPRSFGRDLGTLA